MEKTYQIITDATADLNAELMQESGLEMLPMDVEIEGKRYSYAPVGGDLGEAEFYRALQAGKRASTSQINPLVYESCFERCWKAGMDVLDVCFTSGVSGTIMAAQTCMEELRERYPERKLICVDSLCASAGEGLLARRAAKMQREGHSLEETAAWLEENRLHVCHWFTVDDLQHLRRGGRISAATAIVGTALQVKPILRVDETGHLENVDKVRGRRRALSALVERFDETWAPELDGTVMLGHGACLEDAEFVAGQLRERHPGIEIDIVYMGPIIGAHTGPGTVALLYWGSKR